MVVCRALGMSSVAEAEDRSLLRDSKPATAAAGQQGMAEHGSSTMETTENEHRKFELNALRYRQPVQFPEQWRYVLVLSLGRVHVGILP